jgi:membrane-associated PAP2 superfamily phosphatase
LIIGTASLAWSRLRPYGRAGFFFAAVLALGPGLLVNGIFKPHWCRPRPAEIVEFGGNQPFVSVWAWNSLSESRSFPSGHASTGFYLMVPAFLLYRRRRGLALAFVFVGLLCGGFMGLARVVQGGHFPSDVVWSCGMVYLSGLVLSYVFSLGRCSDRAAEPDETSEFEPAAIAPDTDVPALVDQSPSTQEEGDRRKAA